MSFHDSKVTLPAGANPLAASSSSVAELSKAKAKARPTKAMIDRYSWYEVTLLYAGIAVFLFFVLSPFIEGFLVSLKPLAQLFSTPYSFIPKVWSFDAYVNMWVSVPMLGMHIFNSFFISSGLASRSARHDENW